MRNLTFFLFFSITILLVIFLCIKIFPFLNKPQVTINHHNFYVEIAKTEAQKEKGLGDRKSLEENHGMYFPFETSGNYAFWMKDMEFPIDIIYISNERIVNIFTDTKPALDPSTTVVRPTQNVDAVLEINAGETERNNIKVGDKVNLNF
ncbi:MAG TPA: DUF192 domain-containing protein [Patescibacteria group bacterium]